MIPDDVLVTAARRADAVLQLDRRTALVPLHGPDGEVLGALILTLEPPFVEGLRRAMCNGAALIIVPGNVAEPVVAPASLGRLPDGEA